MNELQMKLAEFLIQNETKQWPNSDYFTNGASLKKLSDRFAISESALLTEFETMAVTVLQSGVLPTAQLSIDLQNKKDELQAEAEAAAANTPQPISPFQLRRTLKAMGLFDDVEAAVAQASDEVKDGWEYATSFDINDTLVQSMAQALGLTNQELLEFFLAAKNVT
jgi:AraC-like DNA-binding protein